MSVTPKQQPWIVHINYRMRMIGFAILFAAIALHIAEKNYSLVSWLLLGTLFLVYPHLQNWRVLKAGDPVKTELNNLIMDSALLGMAVAALGFPLWISFSAMLGTLTNNATTQGWRGILNAVLTFGGGALLWVVVFGLGFSPQTDLPVTLICIVGLTGYSLAIGYLSSVRNNQLRLTREKLLLREKELLNSENKFRELFHSARIPMLLIDPGNRQIIEANNAAKDYYGYPPSQWAAMTFDQINTLPAEEIAAIMPSVVQQGSCVFQFKHRLATGSIRDVEVYCSLVKIGDQDRLYAIVHDNTESKKLENQIHDLAFYDELTKLPNRRLLLDRLDKVISSSSRTRRHAALLYLGLDNFKSLNDLHGHDVGDLLLIKVADRLLGNTSGQDSVARLGGDEFVILLTDLPEKLDEAVVQAREFAEKIRLALSQPYQINWQGAPGFVQDIELNSSSSIGVTLFFDRAKTPLLLLKRAEMAMYRAKEAGRNMIQFFDPAMQHAIETRAALETDLHRALETGQFMLFYQAQVNAKWKPQGAEVLLRWQHPRRGLVTPGQFIPLAESSGLILPIGAWVLDTVCAQIKSWENQAPFRDLVIAVNVSSKQFQQANFVDQIKSVVLKHGIHPMSLKLELTESLALENVEDTICKMKSLKEFGVSFSMDDFGTGYSSLSYLKRLPLDQIKIDQSFVQNITSDSADKVIVMTITDLGMNFELEVIAEGVETEEQYKLLRRCGCENYQGYYFSKPKPLDQFEAWIMQKYNKVGSGRINVISGSE